MNQALNCWEYMQCGREVGGAKVHELGVCPTATNASCDGMNSGTNAGRMCWSIAGTYCGGIVQGTFAQKEYNCSQCAFFQAVQREENRSSVELFAMGFRMHRG